ncbi:MAG: TetR/AcrR family transcriptional regulator [Candidatus Abyssobacteria bacterium SURF_5]|uniref:TetR/AcrR family transcriptional regulator n=1 Tax=Abyssobacteria bacterium (strain SURF_5) TaxID=2093360 RepID=A0A3A4MWB4_ABYX5|nr:MAG: TetR/AcrR family transcriptional regulator [Candidatus Abyssubacteria bacterium SURF_5]
MAKRDVAKQRRKQIISGLYDCLAHKGHEEVSIRDIARAANVSYGALHYYFCDKKEITLAFVDDFVRRQEEKFEGLASSVCSWERLRIMIETATQELVFNERTARVFLNLYHTGCTDDEVRKILLNSYKRFRKAVQGVIEYGISRGEFAEVDPKQAALLIVCALEGLYLQVAMDRSICEKAAADKLLFETIGVHLNPRGRSM